MTELWVVNSSPLIVLGKAGCLELLQRLAGRLVVPAAVIREVSVRQEESLLMAFLKQSGQVRIESDGELTPQVLAWDLGSGEIPGDFTSEAAGRGPRGSGRPGSPPLRRVHGFEGHWLLGRYR